MRKKFPWAGTPRIPSADGIRAYAQFGEKLKRKRKHCAIGMGFCVAGALLTVPRQTIPYVSAYAAEAVSWLAVQAGLEPAATTTMSQKGAFIASVGVFMALVLRSAILEFGVAAAKANLQKVAANINAQVSDRARRLEGDNDGMANLKVRLANTVDQILILKEDVARQAAEDVGHERSEAIAALGELGIACDMDAAARQLGSVREVFDRMIGQIRIEPQAGAVEVNAYPTEQGDRVCFLSLTVPGEVVQLNDDDRVCGGRKAPSGGLLAGRRRPAQPCPR